MRSLTPRILAELLHHEGLVPEAYRDSRGIWTWSVGVTDASGHWVGRYRDNPQPIERSLEVFAWLLIGRYLPAVLAAFGVRDPAEHELGAALSFHWNTGALPRAAWLRRHLAGDRGAREAILDWRRPPEVLPRRRKEQALFFDGVWSGDGTVLLYDVAKPSYRPVNPRRVEVGAMLERVLGSETVEASPADPPAVPTCPPPERLPSRSWFDRLFD